MNTKRLFQHIFSHGAFCRQNRTFRSNGHFRGSVPAPSPLPAAPGPFPLQFLGAFICALSLLLFVLPAPFSYAEQIRYGAEEGWGSTLSRGLRETSGWKGYPALTLAPLGRNPFNTETLEGDIPPAETDMLLLSGSEGISNPAGGYRIAGNYEISDRYPARGENSIRPVDGGLSLYPAAGSMWAPGQRWGDFTLDFRLRPASLRSGEVFFYWEGRDCNGRIQSVEARVEKRRLVWYFRNFFHHGIDRSLNLKLESPPLIPGEWRHHRIRFKQLDSGAGRSGASPGLLEYLVDGVASDMVHALPDGQEGEEPFQPCIGTLSRQPLLLAPSFSGYFDEFRMASAYAVRPPAGGYADLETSSSGAGKTLPIDSGYPGSSLSSLRVRVQRPQAARVRFYARALDSRKEAESAGFPNPGSPEWIHLEMEEEPQDPTGFGNWYIWQAPRPLTGRYFIIGYIMDPDPAADLAPVLSALEVNYTPRLPPRPPQDYNWVRDNSGRILLSWNTEVEEDVAGWWISWGPRPGDYASVHKKSNIRGTLWIPRIPGNTSGRQEYLWPETTVDRIIYSSIRAAWSEGAPSPETRAPSDYRALSKPSREIYFHP